MSKHRTKLRRKKHTGGKQKPPRENRQPVVRVALFDLSHEVPHILLVRERVCSPDYPHPCLKMPGGKVERGESWEEALRREFQEETGTRFPDTLVACRYLEEKDRRRGGSFPRRTYLAFSTQPVGANLGFHSRTIGGIGWYRIDTIPIAPTCCTAPMAEGNVRYLAKAISAHRALIDGTGYAYEFSVFVKHAYMNKFVGLYR